MFSDNFSDLRACASGREPRSQPNRSGHVGDPAAGDMRDVVEHRNRVSADIAEGLFEIGESQQLLAAIQSVLQFEPPHAADVPVWRIAARSIDGRHGWLPAVMPLKSVQHIPDHAGRPSMIVLLKM